MGVVLALVFSLAANVYLFRRHRAAPAVVPTSASVATVAPACPPPVIVPPPAVTIDAALPVAPACPKVVQPDCSAVEKKLADTEAKLEEHLPPGERYKHALRAVDVETRARALLDPIFAGISKSPHAYDVECHGNVCKVSGADPSLSFATWTQEVQRHGGFQGWSFSSWDVYAIMGTPAETAQSKLMGTIGSVLNPDAGLVSCSGGKEPAGSLTLQIALDQATRLLHVTASGSLANDPIGVCVRKHVQGALDTFKVPDDAGSFSQEIPLLR